MHILRKLLRRTGIDLHKYTNQPDKLDWLKSFNIKTVIDVGANTGQFKREIREKLPCSYIYSFEPLRECYDKLKKEERTDKMFKAFNFALGDSNTTSVINKSSYTLSSSLLPMSNIHKEAFPHTKDSTPETIEVRRMDDALKDINMDMEILIKIDTQGYEDRVIRGGKDTLAKARVLIVENSFVPLYENQTLFGNIYSALTELGFTYHGALHQKIGKNGEILFEDSLFVRVTL